MEKRTIELVQSSFKKVMPIADQAAEIFYNKLFEKDPSLRPLFKGDISEQGKKLMMMLSTAVNGLTRLDQIVPAVQNLGRRHAGYGVTDQMYETVGSALLETLAVGLGDEFTDEVKQAWTDVYMLLASVMQEATKEIKV